MKSIIAKILTATAAGFIYVSSASALTFTLNQSDTHTFTAENSSSWTYSGTLDLAGVGFNPATMDAISPVTVTFWFNDISGSYTTSLSLGGIALDSGNFSSDFTLSGGLSGTMLGDLNADGKINYTIVATNMSISGGDDDERRVDKFQLTGERLVATYTNVSSDTPRVADGGSTALLLGATLAGIGLVARRRKS
ncbi:MAG: hypothetical protein WCQ89_16295 [Verrucomicrobiota bacterium]